MADPIKRIQREAEQKRRAAADLEADADALDAAAEVLEGAGEADQSNEESDVADGDEAETPSRSGDRGRSLGRRRGR